VQIMQDSSPIGSQDDSPPDSPGRDCCEARRPPEFLVAAACLSSPDVETRAVLRERLRDSLQELSELRDELVNLRRWQDGEAVRQQACNLRPSSLGTVDLREIQAQSAFGRAVAQSSDSHSDVRDRIRRRHSAMISGSHIGHFAQLKLILHWWRRWVTQREVLQRTVLRFDSASCESIAAICVSSWKLKVLERKRRRAERWKVLARRFATKFAASHDVSFVRMLLWEWFKERHITYTIKHVDTIQRERKSFEAQVSQVATEADEAKGAVAEEGAKDSESTMDSPLVKKGKARSGSRCSIL